MILITDAHVGQAFGNVDPFFQMLELLSKRDDDIVFLGDIFDLWVALPGYEDPIQQRFLDWCDANRHRRTIGYVEGNHEFFVAHRHAEHFSWIATAEHSQDGVLFIHGDLVNPEDKNYLRFRKITKNPITRTLVRFFPGGPKRVHQLKADLKNTNKEFRLSLPEKWLIHFAEKRLNEKIRLIVAGHFHQTFEHDIRDRGMLQVLPDWLATQKIGILDPATNRVNTVHWRELEGADRRGSGPFMV